MKKKGETQWRKLGGGGYRVGTKIPHESVKNYLFPEMKSFMNFFFDVIFIMFSMEG
jgi:hypothetical protein